MTRGSAVVRTLSSRRPGWHRRRQRGAHGAGCATGQGWA